MFSRKILNKKLNLIFFYLGKILNLQRFFKCILSKMLGALLICLKILQGPKLFQALQLKCGVAAGVGSPPRPPHSPVVLPTTGMAGKPVRLQKHKMQSVPLRGAGR